jgi:hypothetical protein
MDIDIGPALYIILLSEGKPRTLSVYRNLSII